MASAWPERALRTNSRQPAADGSHIAVQMRTNLPQAGTWQRGLAGDACDLTGAALLRRWRGRRGVGHPAGRVTTFNPRSIAGVSRIKWSHSVGYQGCDYRHRSREALDALSSLRWNTRSLQTKKPKKGNLFVAILGPIEYRAMDRGRRSHCLSRRIPRKKRCCGKSVGTGYAVVCPES